MTSFNAADIDLDEFKVKQLTSTSKILLDTKNILNLQLDEDEIVDLILKFDTYLNLDSNQKLQDLIINVHPGGRQTSVVYEVKLANKTVAIKIYRYIVNHLLIHTMASNYLSQSQEFRNYTKEIEVNGNILFPKTLAIKISEKQDNRAILIQEWIKNGQDIYVKYPNNHVQIIRDITRIISQKFSFMVDIMTKNWQINDQDNLYYSDLILFRPNGELLDKIKMISEQLS